MLFISNEITDPFFNIASEEYVFTNYNDNILMLYINEPSVIIGKHQNALAEINYRYITENDIKVIRRISGGGAVYHDIGNLNFTIIENGMEGRLVNFEKFLKPVIDIIQKYGINIKIENKNSLLVNGFKVSGNAEHVYKSRVMHHGTILISADLFKLSSALANNFNKYTDRAVKSIRSKVSNINGFIKQPVGITDIKNQLLQYFRQKYRPDNYYFSSNDTNNIEKLIEQKYSTWEWNFGYSPNYIFEDKILINEKETDIQLNVENGLIKEAKIKNFKKIEDLITGARHEYNDVKKILKNYLKTTPFEVNETAWKFF